MSTTTANEPLDFNFLQSPPGKRVLIEPHQLHIHCRGAGDVTVLFEAGLGGSALEWDPVVNLLGPNVSTCVYDRAGYGWSERSPFPAHASRLALEADLLLKKVGIEGPLILVGHSFGGFVSRRLADITKNSVVGIVLIDTSHEEQLKRFEVLGGAALVPSGNNFVMRGSGVPENLPKELFSKVNALSRLRKTYDASHGEMSNFRLSTEQVMNSRTVLPFSVTVVMRGVSPYTDDEHGQKKTEIWKELQKDLSTLGTQGKLVVAGKSGHHIHVDEPELIKREIMELLYEHEQKQKQ